MTEHQQLHILIAEDDFDDAEIITEIFAAHPAFIQVNLVNNGLELLNYLKNETIKIPDLILTDINMPILNGIEALRQIYEDSGLKEIPAFVYSTTINPIYEQKCRELGIKGFIIKPFNLAEFNAIPSKILKILNLE